MRSTVRNLAWPHDADIDAFRQADARIKVRAYIVVDRIFISTKIRVITTDRLFTFSK